MVGSLLIRVPPVEIAFHNRNTKDLHSNKGYGLETPPPTCFTQYIQRHSMQWSWN